MKIINVFIIGFIFTFQVIMAQDDPGMLMGDIDEGSIECGYTEEMDAKAWASSGAIREKLLSEKRFKAGAPPVLSWPVRPSGDVYAPGYYVTSNQVDLMPGAGVLDYAGGTRTYNGHSGIDIRIWPFYWTMMDNDEVAVIAAADGVITVKTDGNFDRNCQLSAPTPANRIDILHNGGWSTLYLHLKSGSLTSKNIGDAVVRGEFLGTVGSSGNSTNPHLHFGVKDMMGTNIEPYAGPSNPGQASLWDVQKPYLESSIVKLMTHFAAPSLNNCSAPANNTTDSPNIRNHFLPGQVVTFGTYFMAPQNGQSATHTVFNPFGGIQWQWVTNFNTTFTRNAQNFNAFLIPQNAFPGTWKFSVSFDGNNQVAEHHFTVFCPVNANIVGNHSDGDGYVVSNMITSTAVAGSNDDRIHYEAGNFIELKPGFRAVSGCSFRTRLDACVVNGQ